MGLSDHQDLRARLERLANAHPTVGLAVGVVRDHQMAEFVGRGFADVKSGRLIGNDTVFRVASITKTFTAIAVMQLWERGLVDLDAPVERYVRSLRIERRGHSAPTIRHLLTHTGGFGELAHASGALRPDFGESVPAGTPLPTLREFYGGGPVVHAEPGTRFVYGNHSPAVLGQLVEDVTGRSLADYVRAEVLAPLGMRDSDLVRSGRVAGRLATGYEVGARGVRVTDDREMVTVGAASLYSTPADMGRYVAALLSGGRGEHGSVLEPATLVTMFEPHYQPDPRIPGIGLAFFRHDLGGITVVGHQGTHPGFHSQILLAPQAGVGVLAFTNGGRNADFWLPSAVAGILADELGVPPVRIRDDIALRPDLWSDLCGWYRLDARLIDTRLRGMIGAGAEVFVAGDELKVRFLTPIPQLARGFALRPDDPDDPLVFRADLGVPDLEPMRFVFARDQASPTRLLFDAMPLVLPRHPEATNPRRWATAAGLLALATGTGLVVARRSPRQHP